MPDVRGTVLAIVLAAIALAPAARSSPARSSSCPSTLANALASTRSARQLVTVEAGSRTATSASLRLWRRSGRCWIPAAGPWTARLGRNGLSDRHREGDGTTPSGAYGFGRVVYGIAANPGDHLRYHRLVCGDWWDEVPASPSYNTFPHLRC